VCARPADLCLAMRRCVVVGRAPLARAVAERDGGCRGGHERAAPAAASRDGGARPRPRPRLRPGPTPRRPQGHWLRRLSGRLAERCRRPRRHRRAAPARAGGPAGAAGLAVPHRRPRRRVRGQRRVLHALPAPATGADAVLGRPRLAGVLPPALRRPASPPARPRPPAAAQPVARRLVAGATAAALAQAHLDGAGLVPAAARTLDAALPGRLPDRRPAAARARRRRRSHARSRRRPLLVAVVRQLRHLRGHGRALHRPGVGRQLRRRAAAGPRLAARARPARRRGLDLPVPGSGARAGAARIEEAR
jgi:hypothetical protein